MGEYKWRLSPSKFESSRGCACFEEEQSYGKKYKDRGTDLHKLIEIEDAPLDGLDSEDRDAVMYCRNHLNEVRRLYEPIMEAKELLVQASDSHPRGKIDYAGVSADKLLLVLDWKMGTTPVPAEGNAQFEAYALMAYHHFTNAGCEIERILVGPVQPALDEHPLAEILPTDLPRIEGELKAANDRVADPFKTPDATDPDKCKRCAHLLRCPAVQKGLVRVVEGLGLPIPSSFDPGSLADDRTRIIAQDLVTILSGWCELVKSKNKEYAVQNGGTIGGVWNCTTRGNGVEVQDVALFAEKLVEQGVLDDPKDILNFTRIRKTDLVEGLSSPERPQSDVAAIVKEIEEQIGVPRPPVSVFRRGGAKQVRAAEMALDIPQLKLPDGWK